MFKIVELSLMHLIYKVWNKKNIHVKYAIESLKAHKALMAIKDIALLINVNLKTEADNGVKNKDKNILSKINK